MLSWPTEIMSRFTLYLGADHRGFALKEKLRKKLADAGHRVVDLSPTHEADDDYPLHAFRVADAMAKDPQSRGILICGSGVGVTMAANRRRHIRAFDAHDEKEIVNARRDEDANVLCLSGDRLSASKALKFIDAFLSTRASNAARHKRRIAELS